MQRTATGTLAATGVGEVIVTSGGRAELTVKVTVTVAGVTMGKLLGFDVPVSVTVAVYVPLDNPAELAVKVTGCDGFVPTTSPVAFEAGERVSQPLPLP